MLHNTVARKPSQRTGKKAFDDPGFKDAFLISKGFWPYANYGGVKECAEFKTAMLEMGERFKPLLTGK